MEGGQAVLLIAGSLLMRTGSIRCGGAVVQYLERSRYIPLRHPCMVHGIYVPYIPRPRVRSQGHRRSTCRADSNCAKGRNTNL